VANLTSDPIAAAVGKSTCTIGNIGAVRVNTSANSTVLSWDILSGATSYNIYRMTAAKDFELVKNVTENSYTLYLASGSVVYEDFAVRGVCDDTTESSVPAIASRVQTGPGFLAVLVALSALLSIFFVRRRFS
jgi:hypothetical protein